MSDVVGFNARTTIGAREIDGVITCTFDGPTGPVLVVTVYDRDGDQVEQVEAPAADCEIYG